MLYYNTGWGRKTYQISKRYKIKTTQLVKKNFLLTYRKFYAIFKFKF